MAKIVICDGKISGLFYHAEKAEKAEVPCIKTVPHERLLKVRAQELIEYTQFKQLTCKEA